MKPKPAEPVRGLGPTLTPTAVTLLLVLLSVLPFQIPGYAAVTPLFVLMSVYHWSIYRPEHLPYVAVFAVGLLFDLLTTAPGSAVGLTPLVLLFVRAVVLSRRRYFVGRTFPFVWSGFTLATAVTSACLWGIGSLLTLSLLEPRSFAIQAVLTVGFFPLMTLLFARVQRATLAQ